MYPPLIAIGANRPEAGKDTIGIRLVSEYGYRRYSFADALKQEVQVLLTDEFYRNEVWDQMPECARDATLTCLALGILDPFAKPTSPEMRLLLQSYGTEFRRAQDEDYWVRSIDDQIKVDNARLACITDMRFENEWNYARCLHGETWYVWRPLEPGQQAALRHRSEGALDNLPHHAYFQNIGTVQDLWEKVDERMLYHELPNNVIGVGLEEAQRAPVRF